MFEKQTGVYFRETLLTDVCQNRFNFFLQKIERLKSELHLLDAEGKKPNKHMFFFDTKKEGKL